ncbi:UNVERIFIED_CONTAM: hypothetical protein Slati_0888000 [Sesamum latifolium]|uniref:Reverse transcriptase zinc-binding domain-containing protein n=1 Tax=Sesamum latifolium TaxID=2727402 RepID=A0AAW2XMX9_9LAMI
MHLPLTTKLSMVITDGEWSWPFITDMECMEIIHNLPAIHYGDDSITWRSNWGNFTTAAAYDVFHPSRPKVGWSSLLLDRFKIPRYSFVLWLAILEKLSTMDKPRLVHLGGECVLCHCAMETHEHLFFKCIYSRRCLRELNDAVWFSWPNRAWGTDIEWASRKWNGKHYVNAAYRALLSSTLYHIWQERNRSIALGQWRWRKILRLRNQMLGRVKYSIGTGEHIKLWQDPWHHMGILIHRFP